MTELFQTVKDDSKIGARALLEEKGVEIVEADTPDIRDKFNELAKTKKVAAIIHVTC